MVSVAIVVVSFELFFIEDASSYSFLGNIGMYKLQCSCLYCMCVCTDMYLSVMDYA